MSDSNSDLKKDDVKISQNGIMRMRAADGTAIKRKLTEQELSNLASQQVASTADLIFRLINYELENLRLKVRDGGLWLRAFVARQISVLSPKLSNISRKMLTSIVEDSRKKCYEGSAALPHNYIAPKDAEEYVRISSVTFNDVADVLTTDEVCDGVVFAYTLRCPAWEALPVREKVLYDEESEENRFQLFNRPMSMTMTLDDDDCRMSRASSCTRFTTDQPTNSDVDKLKSVESQLAMLSQQIQLLLQSKNSIASKVNSSNMSDDFSPAVSDDEGKGPSLCSPAASRKAKSSTISSPESTSLPPVAPPPGCPPPPPPPPADLMSRSFPSLKQESSEESLVVSAKVSSDENKVPDVPAANDAVVRPSVSDLRTVQLRRTGTMKSPGGTPLPKSRVNRDRDQGGYLANALREKFRHVNNSLSEHEDEPSGWVDDE